MKNYKIVQNSLNCSRDLFKKMINSKKMNHFLGTIVLLQRKNGTKKMSIKF